MRTDATHNEMQVRNELRKQLSSELSYAIRSIANPRLGPQGDSKSLLDVILDIILYEKLERL